MTKRGTAHFTDDALRFEESVGGYVRSLHRGYWQRDEWLLKSVFVGYIFALAFVTGWLVNAVVAGDVPLVAVPVAVVAVLWVVNHARGFRSPDRIPLDWIEDVSSTRGTKGLTRPRFVVTYVADGSRYRRRVAMPSLYTPDGERAFERAREAFVERGFDPKTGR